MPPLLSQTNGTQRATCKATGSSRFPFYSGGIRGKLGHGASRARQPEEIDMNRRFIHSLLAAVLVLGFAGMASAQTRATISKMKQWCCTTPPIFAAGNPASMQGQETFSIYVETGGAFPQSVMVDAGELRSLSYPQSWCNYGACSAPAIPGFLYVKGFTGVKNPAATFAASGGPAATVDYCFNGPGICSPPATSAGTAMMNGRLTVKPGANKYGGAMSIIGDTVPTSLGRWQNSAMTGSPWERVYVNVKNEPVGYAQTWARFSAPGPRTLISGPNSTILGSTPNAYLQNNAGGPFHTGTLSVSITMNFNPQLGPTLAINLKGYDNRTASGAGHLQVVSGQFYNGRAGSFGSNGQGARLNLPEPGPSLGLVAGAAVLLLVGFSRGRRRH